MKTMSNKRTTIKCLSISALFLFITTGTPISDGSAHQPEIDPIVFNHSVDRLGTAVEQYFDKNNKDDKKSDKKATPDNDVGVMPVPSE